VTADVTVTFGHPKPALVGLPSAASCGRVVVADIGLVPLLADDDGPAPEVLAARDVAPLFPRREAEAHKGDFGRLGLLAGSQGMSGAAVLSARAALASGAGLVTVLSEECVRAAVHTLLAEAMSAPAETGFTGFAALAVGPGLGASEEARANVRRALVSQLPSVFDADALNAHAGAPEAFRRTPETVLTPHPGEAARLLSTTAAAVNRDREAAALELSCRSSAVVILKGYRSLVASPAGRVVKVLAGNPSMAKGGSGDVLTGIVGALLARGFSAWDAATAGALLHGLAGDLAREASHEESVVASDLVQALPEAFHAVNESGRSPSDPLATSPAPPPA
jgi:NAD(P)H-hydrate epimerase